MTICVKTRARISLLLFRVSFVNSLLILHCDTLSWHHLSWDPLSMGGTIQSPTSEFHAPRESKLEKKRRWSIPKTWYDMENVTLNFLGNCERKKAKKRATILYKKLSLSIENGWNHVTFWSVGGGIECEVLCSSI